MAKRSRPLSTENPTTIDQANIELESLDAERINAYTRFQFALGTIDIVKKIIGVSPYIIVGYLFFDTLKAFAGRNSFADINILTQFLVNLKVNEWFAWIIAGGSTIFGLRERRLRKNKVGYLTDRIHELEQNLDPSRSSSELTKTGETKKGD